MAFDAFLTVPAIPGGCTDKERKGCIEVLSYSWGVTQPARGLATTGGKSAARADFQDLSIVKAADKASPKLALACIRGEVLGEATLWVCRSAGQKERFMRYDLTDVTVSSFGAGSGESFPTDTVCLSYRKIGVIYYEWDLKTKKPQGHIFMTWDLKDNTGG